MRGAAVLILMELPTKIENIPFLPRASLQSPYSASADTYSVFAHEPRQQNDHSPGCKKASQGCSPGQSKQDEKTIFYVLLHI